MTFSMTLFIPDIIYTFPPPLFLIRLAKWSESHYSCPTLFDSMNYTVHGILQARILEWVAFSFSRGSSQARDPTQISDIAGRFFTVWVPRIRLAKCLSIFPFFFKTEFLDQINLIVSLLSVSYFVVYYLPSLLHLSFLLYFYFLKWILGSFSYATSLVNAFKPINSP